MTGRLPFDPKRMSDARPKSAPTGGDRPLRVSELAARIEDAVRQGLPQRVRVVGEVSGAVERTHWYFNAKDADAVIACVMFASAARKGGTKLENGREYVLSGRVEYYAKGGKVSFLVDRLEPVGEGALDAAFRALCEEIRSLGWFDPARKKALPTFPRRVAVVTSASGAALQDVLNTMARRCPAVGVLVVDVRVQGERASDEIAGAIRGVSENRDRLGVDAMIVTRGGGSKEDLWSFNERVVAQAIVESSIPIVAAIGHETDTTIAELVADERASTPTQAAMRLTPDRAELNRQVVAAAQRLKVGLLRGVSHERERLRAASRHPLFKDPSWLLERAGMSVRGVSARLTSVATDRLMKAQRRVDGASIRHERVSPSGVVGRSKARLGAAEARFRVGMAGAVREASLRLLGAERQLESVGPRSVLGRGYSWTRTKDGRLVRSVADVSPGGQIRTQVLDGVIDSVVGQPGDQSGNDLRERIVVSPRPRSRSSAKDASQLGLFPGGQGT